MTNRRDAKAWLRICLISALLLVILGYSGFEARKILTGPHIRITSPSSEGITADPYVLVTGIAQNIKEIQMNGNPIYIDEQGNFRERFLLISGYNIIKLEAKDKFDKQTEEVIELVYQG